jgi:hypothetical protein
MRPPAGLSGRHGSLVTAMLERSGSAGWLDRGTGKARIGILLYTLGGGGSSVYGGK